MPALRIAMVVVPPLLAGLIRHGVGARIPDVTVTEFVDLHQVAACLRDTSKDVVIVGPSASATDTALIRRIVPHARVLTVSADLARLVDVESGETFAFAPDALAEACGGKRGSAI